MAPKNKQSIPTDDKSEQKRQENKQTTNPEKNDSNKFQPSHESIKLRNNKESKRSEEFRVENEAIESKQPSESQDHVDSNNLKMDMFCNITTDSDKLLEKGEDHGSLIKPSDKKKIFLKSLIHFTKTNISLAFLIVKHSMDDIFDFFNLESSNRVRFKENGKNIGNCKDVGNCKNINNQKGMGLNDEDLDADENEKIGDKSSNSHEAGKSCEQSKLTNDKISKQILPFKLLRISGCEISDCNIIQFIRKSIFCKLNELTTIYEGEIVNISLIDRIFKLTLRSLKGSRTVTLTDRMYELVLMERLLVGDIVYLELNSNIIRKIGRSETRQDYDIEIGQKIPCPREEVEKNRYVSHIFSFYELDLCNRQNMNEAQLSEYHGNNYSSNREFYSNKKDSGSDMDHQKQNKTVNSEDFTGSEQNHTKTDEKTDEKNRNQKNNGGITDQKIKSKLSQFPDVTGEGLIDSSSTQDGLSESLCWLRACYDSDQTIISYLERGLGEMETGILIVEDCHLMERRILVRILNLLENARFMPIVLFCTDNLQYIRHNRELLKNIQCLTLLQNTTDSLLKQKTKQLSKEKSQYLQQIAGEKGEKFALSLINLAGDVSKEELKTIVEQLSV